MQENTLFANTPVLDKAELGDLGTSYHPSRYLWVAATQEELSNLQQLAEESRPEGGEQELVASRTHFTKIAMTCFPCAT